MTDTWLLKKLESATLFLAVLLLPTQLGLHLWPQFSYIYSLRIDYLSPTIYFWDLLVLLLISLFIAQGKKINYLSLNLLLIFLLSQALSLSASNVGVGLVRLEQYLITGLFGVYIASQNRASILAKLRPPITISIICVSILAVWQFVIGGSVGFWILGERSFNLQTPGIASFDYYGRVFLRPYSVFSHPNVLAGYLVCLLLLYPSRYTLFTGGLAIFLGMSRSAFLASFIGTLYFVNWRKFLKFSPLLLILAPFIFTRFDSLLNFDFLSVTRRIDLNFLAIKIFIEHPVFGVGVNNFISYASDNLLAGASRFLQPVHNIYLLILAETGIVGFVGWAILLYPFKNFKFSILNFQIKIALLTILFLGLFDHYFLTSPQGLRLWWLVWGLLL